MLWSIRTPVTMSETTRRGQRGEFDYSYGKHNASLLISISSVIRMGQPLPLNLGGLREALKKRKETEEANV